VKAPNQEVSTPDCPECSELTPLIARYESSLSPRAPAFVDMGCSGWALPRKLGNTSLISLVPSSRDLEVERSADKLHRIHIPAQSLGPRHTRTHTPSLQQLVTRMGFKGDWKQATPYLGFCVFTFCWTNVIFGL
jgi:hypothetical protein